MIPWATENAVAGHM